MKLNTDLFRNVLLFLEAQSYYVSNCDGEIESMPVWFGKISEHFPNNDQAEVFYALKNLEQAGYINLTSCAADNADSRCYVNCITFRGHEFIASVRNDDRWSGIKKALPAIRDYSIQAINAVAQGMTSAAITAYLQRNP